MDQNLEDIDSLSVARLAGGGPVGEMSSAQSTEIDGPLSMALGGLVDIDSLSVAAFAEGGEAKDDDAYTEAEIARMRQAMQMGQPQQQEQQAPTRQAVKRIAPRPTAQGPQQKPTLARQQLYALPPYSLDMTGKLGQAGPIRRAQGSPEYGEVAEPPELKATPQNPLLGFVAKALKAREDVSKDLNSPTAALLNLILPSSQTVEKWSYGDPLFRMPPSGTGGYVPVTSRDKGYVAETIGYAPIGLPAKAAASGAMVGPPLGIIRPKGGGNLLFGEVEKAIAPLRPTVTMPDNLGKPQALPPSEVSASLKDLITRNKAEGYPTAYAENLLKDVEPMAALDDWIKNKFGNYIKKQMGTEDDPVRKLADEMSEKVQADYQAGLKRIAKMKDDIAKAKARGKNTDVSERELADEIDRVEEAFQNASILPSQLGPYTHVSSSLGEAREKAGMSPFPVAKSMQGKAYEELADVPFIPKTAGEIKKNVETMRTMGPGWAQTSEDVLEKNPWILKLKDEDLVYRIRDYDVNEKQIFTHTIDELRNALNPNSGLPQNLLLKPEDMQGLGIEKAFRHVNKINDWRSQQRVAANLEEAKRSAVTIKEYPESRKRLQWQQLKPAEYTELPPGYSINPAYEGPALFGPDGKKLTTFSAESEIPVQQQALNFIAKNDLEKALQYEGSTMRHCVGGYCDDVWSGQTNIFSLRDRKGEPHVTIETSPPEQLYPVSGEDFAKLDQQTKTLYREYVRQWRQRNPDVEELTDKNLADALAEAGVPPNPPQILQIKGKGNAKPKEEYIPFVQDFIKSQQWSRIGDLDYTDLVALKPGLLKNAQDRGIVVDVVTEQGGKPYITKTEFNRLADLFGGMNKYD